MKLVVDSNIIFSSLLNPNSQIGEIILIQEHDFFVPEFCLKEIDKYQNKIIQLSNYNPKDYLRLRDLIFSKINIVFEDFISEKNWQRAIELVYDVDEKDAAFIALALELDCRLWTGDKKLIEGLNQKSFYQTITTEKF